MVWPLTIGGLIVFLALAGVLAWSVGKKREQRDRYLSVISRTQPGSSKDDAADRALVKQRADLAKKLKEASRESQERKKDKTSIKQMLQVAGIEVPVSHYWIASAVFAVIVLLMVTPARWPVIAKGFVVVTAFLGMPRLFLKWKAARRQKKFLEEFAEALDAMARLLQAGMPISEAIAMGSREFTGPLKDELIRIYENQKVGVPLGEATLQMARRMPLTEVHMFAAALQIQSETGSSLSEVLLNLSGVIRARFRLRRKVRALSSEARSSAAIIAALPVLVALGLYATRPEYVGLLFTTPKGKVLLAGCGIWMSFGVLIMRQMINFRI